MPINRLYNIWFRRITERWSHLRVTQRRNLTYLIVGIHKCKLKGSRPGLTQVFAGVFKPKSVLKWSKLASQRLFREPVRS